MSHHRHLCLATWQDFLAIGPPQLLRLSLPAMLSHLVFWLYSCSVGLMSLFANPPALQPPGHWLGKQKLAVILREALLRYLRH